MTIIDSEQTGLTIVDITTWDLSQVYKVCLYQGPSIPSVNDLPICPTPSENFNQECADLGLMPMGEYRGDIRWQPLDPNDPYYGHDNSANVLSWQDESNFEEFKDSDMSDVTYRSQKHAQIYWQKLDEVSDTGRYEYRYSPTNEFKDLKTFNIIIFYTMVNGQVSILSYGFFDITIEFEKVASIVVDATVEKESSASEFTGSLYTLYYTHSLEAEDSLTKVHPNLVGLITTRTRTQNILDNYLNNRNLISFSSDDSIDTGLVVDANSQKLIYKELGYEDTLYNYYLPPFESAENIYNLFSDKFDLPDLDTFRIKSLLTIDRMCGLFMVFYGANYVIAIPSGYNVTGVAYKLSDNIFNSIFQPTIKIYNRAILIQVGNASYLLNPTDRYSSINIGERKVLVYLDEYTPNPRTDVTILPVFDLGNVVYYNEYGSFKNLYSEDVYPQVGFKGIVDLRYYNDSVAILNQIESEYNIQASLYDFAKDKGATFECFDTGVLLNSGNSITVYEYFPQINVTTRYEYPKVDGAVKYYLDNRILYAVVKSEGTISMYGAALFDSLTKPKELELYDTNLINYYRGIQVKI